MKIQNNSQSFGDDCISNLDNQINKKYDTTKFLNVEVNNSFLRGLSISTACLLLATLIGTLLKYYLPNSNKSIISFLLSDEEGSNNVYIPFQTSSTCLIISLSITIILLIYLIINLIVLNDEKFSKIFFEEISFLFPAFSILFTSMLLVGILYIRNLYSIIINFSIALFSMICAAWLYKKIKKHKNFSNQSLISLNIFFTLMLSFHTYIFLFNLIQLATYSSDNPYQNTKIKNNISISANCLYGAAAVALITVYQDIIFAVMLQIIEIGFLTNSKIWSGGEIICNIVIIGFIMLCILVTIVKYKQVACGYVDNEEMMKNLEKD